MKSKIIDKISEKNLFYKYFLVTLSSLISAIYYNLLILPIHLVSGGTGGIAIILNHIFGLDPSLVIFLLSFALLVIGYFHLSKEDVFAALYITIVYPLFVSAFSKIGEIIYIDDSNALLLVVIAGVLSGVTNGMIYRTGLNTGGLGVLGKIIAINLKTSVNTVTSILNFCVVIVGTVIFGINMLLYAAIYLYISQIVTERFLLGVSKNKMVHIVSRKPKEIVDFLKNDLGHDATVYSVCGQSEKGIYKMIMTMVPNKKYILLKEAVKEIDDKSFVFVCDSYEVRGQDMSLKSVK